MKQEWLEGHKARKRFGQNFLHDRHWIERIVRGIDPKPGDALIEIGPGQAALTREVIACAGHEAAVEIDRDLIARLKQRHPPERLTIHEGDALAFDFPKIGRGLRLVGNLPYNISTPLLFHLADYAETVYDMHFMLQKEVVERMVAEPGDVDFGRLSVMLQYRFWMEWLIDVPPESFDPAPKVDSAVVRLIPKPLSDLRAKSLDKLGKVVLQAFSQRRKMLRNTLKGTLDDTGFAALGIDPTRRAEDIPVEDYVRIANYLS